MGADLVFVGEMTEAYGVGSTENTAWFRFTVDEVFKGRTGAKVEVQSPSQGPACGLELERGTPYLVHASRQTGGLLANSCNGTVPAEDAEQAAFLGTGRPPSPDIPPPPEHGPVFAAQEPLAVSPLGIGIGLTLVGSALLASGVAFVLRRQARS